MLNQHGERAPVKIAERIGAMAAAGDLAGLAVWKRVAAAADVLRRPGEARVGHAAN